MSDHQNPPLPLTFRSIFLRRLTALLRSGECCSIVGAGGVGKTNLVRFLQRGDVQSLYWGDAPVWVVLIDSNALTGSGRSDEFGVLELIAHRLIREAEEREAHPDLLEEFDRLHRGLIAQPDTLLALRSIERMLARLARDHRLQLVLVFDQFDDIWHHLEPRLFQNLRYLRDEFKYRLVYLTITRERLQPARRRTCGDDALVESFWEMFDPHVFGLGVYDEADAHEMVSRIARRNGRAVDDAQLRQAVALTGGHPALLRAITWGLIHNGDAPMNVETLARLPAASAECAKIWHDLTAEEQQVARRLAAGLPPEGTHWQAALDDLLLKEIIRGAPPSLFSPIFRAYVMLQSQQGYEGVSVDTQHRRVCVDGRWLDEPLTPLEFSLLEYFARRAGTICKRDEILAALYSEEKTFDANDERIDTLLRRVREALGEDGRKPRHLITHRGVGVRLARGRIIEG